MTDSPQPLHPASIPDPGAMALFDRQWSLYRKVVDHNYLHHREFGEALHRALAERGDAPFRLLDLACGDAATTADALAGLPVRHYHGIDLSAAALQLAKTHLARLDCEVTLEQRDYLGAMQHYPRPLDVVLISLSLHHLDTGAKRELMTRVRQSLDRGGLFLVYEPASPDGENRAGYLERFEQTNRRAWSALDADEWREVWSHVRDNDLAETLASWYQLGRDAGFDRAEQLFVSADNLYRMFRFCA